MSDVQFDEDMPTITPRQMLQEEDVSSMASFFINRGWAKTKDQASYFLIGIVIICIIISISVFMIAPGRHSVTEPPVMTHLPIPKK